MNEAPIHPDHAQLLLYLAGELSPGERHAIESKLAGDGALRQELDALRTAESAINQGLSSLDAQEPIDARMRSVDRQVSRLLSQWQVDRLTQTAQPATSRRIRRVPVWLYPLSAAALVMVCLGVWYLSFDRNADGTLVMSNDDLDLPSSVDGRTDARPDGRRWDEPGEEDLTPDVALGSTGVDSFGALEQEMARYMAISEALQ